MMETTIEYYTAHKTTRLWTTNMQKYVYKEQCEVEITIKQLKINVCLVSKS